MDDEKDPFKNAGKEIGVFRRAMRKINFLSSAGLVISSAVAMSVIEDGAANGVRIYVGVSLLIFSIIKLLVIFMMGTINDLGNSMEKISKALQDVISEIENVRSRSRSGRS